MASVAVVQVLIWGALCVVGALAVAQMMPPEMMEGVQAMQQGVPGAAAAIDVNPEMLQVIAAITDFGFILRYPEGKEDVTGIPYEPWHYRYIGVDSALEWKESGLVLCKFLEQKPQYFK